MATADKVVLELRAEVEAYQRSLRAADTTFQRTVSVFKTRGNEIEHAVRGNLERIAGAFGLAFAANEAVRFFREVLQSSQSILEVSERLKITTENLQGLQYAAKQSGGSTEALNGALLMFAKNIGEAQTKSGDFYKFLKANHVEITGDVMTDLNSFLDLVKRSGDAAQQERLFMLAFGRGAREIGNAFTGGAGAIRKWIDEAHRAGAITSDKALQAGKDLNRQWIEAATSIKAAFQQMAIGAGPAVIAMINEFSKLVQFLQDHPDVAKALGLASLGYKIGGLPGAAIGGLVGATISGGALSPNDQPFGSDAEAIAAFRRAHQGTQFSGAFDQSPSGTVTPGSIEASKGFKDLTAPLVAPPSTEVERQHSAFQQSITDIEKQTAVLNAEIATVGESAGAQREAEVAAGLYASAEEHHIPITKDLAAAIDLTAKAAGHATEAMAEANLHLQESRDLQQFLGDSLVGLFSSVADGADGMVVAIKNVAKALAEAALQAAILGQGPLAGLLGTGTAGNGGIGGLIGGLFSRGAGNIVSAGFPVYATGGRIPIGGVGIVGEAGAETIRSTPQGAVVVPGNVRSAGGDGPISVGITTHITVVGGDPQDTARALDERDRRIMDAVPKSVAKARANRLTF